MNRSEEAFAIHKAPHIAESTVRNLARATPETHVSQLWARHAFECTDEWWGTVTVIGAGHTMPETFPQSVCDLNDGPTIAVNSAIGALFARNVIPDYVVCRESIDMSSQLRKLPTGRTSAILDIGCHPNTWATAAEVCGQVWWFVPASNHTWDLAAHYGVEPLYGGTSNVTAAVALAQSMLAQRIRLVGCSRAFSEDGRAYAEGTGWESVRLESVDPILGASGEVDHYVGTITGTEAKEALHLASGQRPPLKRERVIPVMAIDGSTRWALETLEGDREWLARFATRRPGLSLYQHAPDVAIQGWGHAPRIEEPVTPVDYRAELVRQCGVVGSVASAIVAGEPVARIAGMIDGAPLVDFAGIGERIMAFQRLKGRGPATQVPELIRVWREAGERVKGWATNGRVAE